MTSKRIILTDEFKGQEKEEGETEKKKTDIWPESSAS